MILMIFYSLIVVIYSLYGIVYIYDPPNIKEYLNTIQVIFQLFVAATLFFMCNPLRKSHSIRELQIIRKLAFSASTFIILSIGIHAIILLVNKSKTIATQNLEKVKNMVIH